jgi:hypothetical protein
VTDPDFPFDPPPIEPIEIPFGAPDPSDHVPDLDLGPDPHVPHPGDGLGDVPVDPAGILRDAEDRLLGDPDDPWRPGQDPRDRPPDPAGTRPKVTPESVLPQEREPLLGPDDTVDAHVVEDDVEQLDDDLGLHVADDEETLPGRILPAPPKEYIDEGSGLPASRYAPRFQFMTGALIACGLAAVVALVVLVAGSTTDNGRETASSGWSSWKPENDSVDDGAAEIAQHVAPKYKLSNGQQIVMVEGGPLSIDTIPLTIALREPATEGGEIKFATDKGVLYRLCGPSTNCAIPGKKSPERYLLLRREALELALYSFHYLDGVKEVVVFMPPTTNADKPTQAQWFSKEAVEQELARPLDATLVPNAPTAGTMDDSPDADTVNVLTLPSLFNFSLTQGNTENRAFLVLDPLTEADLTGKSSTTATTPTATTTTP